MTTTASRSAPSPSSPQAELDDLQRAPRAHPLRPRRARRLAGTTAPRSSYLRDMVERWKSFDWREVEARINAHPNFLTEIDGQTIHFVHVRRPCPDARPLLLAHTYPGSFLEFLTCRPLTDPVPRRTAEDAFDVVIPSMPGFGFSTPVVDGGWTMARVARAYDALMRRPRLRVVRRARHRRRRDGRPRAGDPRPRGLPRRARAAAVLLPVGRPGRVRGLRPEGVRRARAHAVVPVASAATTR